MPVIAPEDGAVLEREPEMAPSSASPQEDQRRAKLQTAVLSALDGTLPRGRELKYWEPKQLSPQHIAWVYDRAAGMKQAAIAEKHDVSPTQVSNVLNHPDAEYLLGELLSVTADRVADPIERMKAFAHEMINVKLEIIRDESTPRTLRNEIAGDFLDRAGYGPQKKISVSSPSIQMPKEQASQLISALDPANEVHADYSGFLRSSASLSLGGKEPGESQTLVDESEQLEDPLKPPQAPSAIEREIEFSKAEELQREAEERKNRLGKRRTA